MQNALSVWRSACAEYDEAFLISILASGWQQVEPDETNAEDRIHDQIKEVFSATNLGLSIEEVRRVIENTPPVPQIRKYFSNNTMEKEITAYEALHIRFEGLAQLAELLIRKYGKQGELIVYDMNVAARLAASKGQTGSVEEFIESFTAEADERNLFTAGLRTELMCKSNRAVVVHIHVCEWARYFQERHPTVGYLMACSTDEVDYRAFNSSLRLQRTQTLMEGGEMCDFRIYAIDS